MTNSLAFPFLSLAKPSRFLFCPDELFSVPALALLVVTPGGGGGMSSRSSLVGEIDSVRALKPFTFPTPLLLVVFDDDLLVDEGKVNLRVDCSFTFFSFGFPIVRDKTADTY